MATLGKYNLPDDLYYERESHLWLKVIDARVLIGLDVLGQESMGDMAYIGFEPVGREVKRGDGLGTLEAAKMVAPILAPISGKIAARNENVARNPRLVNSSPYTDGWLLEMEPSHWNEEKKSLVGGAESVRKFLEQEIKRYKEQGWIE